MSSSVVVEDGRYNGRTARLASGGRWPHRRRVRPRQGHPVRFPLTRRRGPRQRHRAAGDLPQVDDKLEAMTALRRATNDIPVPKDFIVSDPEELERLVDVVGRRARR